MSFAVKQLNNYCTITTQLLRTLYDYYSTACWTSKIRNCPYRKRKSSISTNFPFPSRNSVIQPQEQRVSREPLRALEIPLGWQSRRTKVLLFSDYTVCPLAEAFCPRTQMIHKRPLLLAFLERLSFCSPGLSRIPPARGGQRKRLLSSCSG